MGIPTSMTLPSTSETREVRFASVSDVHLGHKRTKTAFIINNLNKHLVTDAFMSSIDILFIVGDLYDDLLATYSEDYQLIGSWEARLLRKAHRYGVQVRLVEGTKSHDRGQGVQMVTINEAYKKIGKGVDLKYITDLSIEYIEKWGLHVLYVPDDLSPNPQDTLDQVRALLREHKITKVDLAMMHGQFPHQIPAGIGHIPMHDDEAYSELARLIFIGHIHTSTVYKNIYAQGSVDRLSHAEEEPKGFFRAVMGPDHYTVTFIENTGAAIYKTVTCDQDSVAENLIKIGEFVKDIPDGANLRIEANVGNPIFENMALIKERWPMYAWTDIKRNKDKKEAKPLLDHKLVYVPVTLDRQTLHPTLMGRIMQKKYDPAVVALCDTLLGQITGGSNGNQSRPTG
jgi:hypothetical protein